MIPGSPGTTPSAAPTATPWGGADGLVRSPGVDGQLGEIQTPTVYNSVFNLAQLWSGGAVDLADQVRFPVHNPREMASDWSRVIAKLRTDGRYMAAFARLYPDDGLTGANIQDAIAVFEATLVTTDAPFDRWLRGERTALDAQQLQGYRLFKSYGCIACHQGVNAGGNMYQRMGAMGDYFADRGSPLTSADLGRFNVTGDPLDRHMFKVPGLRLAALTPPYFHDGATATLEEAIDIMARYQLGRAMPVEDNRAIAAFIRSLVGRHPALEH